MNTTRHLETQLLDHFSKYRQVIILLGARQVGKTTLLKRLYPQAKYLLCENESVKTVLEAYDLNAYTTLIPTEGFLILDEIHLLSDPGRAAKIIYDQLPKLKLIITGSSSLNIKNKTAESLAGRQITYYLYPLTFEEYLFQKGLTPTLTNHTFDQLIHPKNTSLPLPYDCRTFLKQVLIYGLYPNLINLPQDELYLSNLVDSVIFKDILDLSLIENRQAALKLLKLLAFQIGNLVNLSDLANRCQMDVRTVNRYLLIFQQSFLIYLLPPFHRQPRDEIGKATKVYFYDTGLRNALINDFSPLDLRPDRGQLFENFIVTECFKHNAYQGNPYQLNYWRTRLGSEIDLVLSKGQQILGVEVKWQSGKASTAFTNRYKQARTQVITAQNFIF